MRQLRQLIECGCCQAVIDPSLPVCLACGYCPGCGQRRLHDSELAPLCSECQANFCICCGKCRSCNQGFIWDRGPCSCGHPDDLSKLLETEKALRFLPRSNWILWRRQIFLGVVCFVSGFLAKLVVEWFR